jgi:hypothetical protein
MHGKEKGKETRQDKRREKRDKVPMIPKPMLSSSQHLFPKSAFPCMAGKRNGTAKWKNCENATRKGFVCFL